jgi:hypothetical protein
LIDFRDKQCAGYNKRDYDNFFAITLKIDENTRNAKDWSDRRGRELFDRMRMVGYKI